jgi:hypothetical protein
MLTPYVVSTVFVLAVVVLCFARPNAGRIFLGLFFMAMGIGVHGAIILTNPQVYMGFGNGALIPLYRELSLRVIAALSPVLFGLLVAAFEIAVGLMVLNKQKYVKMGLLGMTVFEIALTPFDAIQFIWLGLAVGQVYLLTKEFDTTFLEMLRSRKRT